MPRRIAAALALSLACLAGPVAAADVPVMTAAAFRDYAARREGRVLVVNLWATWCGPCLAEMPGLMRLRRAVPEGAVDMIGLSLDFDADALGAYLDRHPLNYPVYLAGADVMDALHVEAIPRTMVFDAGGLRVLDHEGYISPQELCGAIAAHAPRVTDCGVQ